MPAFHKTEKIVHDDRVCLHLLLVCFGDVKERVGVVVPVQHARNTAGTRPLCTDTSKFRGVRRSMPRRRWSSRFARWLASHDQRPASQVRASVTDVSDSPAAVDSWASATCSRPATNQNNCRCSCPSHLDTRNYHPLQRLEIIVFSSCGAGLGSLVTSCGARSGG